MNYQNSFNEDDQTAAYLLSILLENHISLCLWRNT